MWYPISNSSLHHAALCTLGLAPEPEMVRTYQALFGCRFLSVELKLPVLLCFPGLLLIQLFALPCVLFCFKLLFRVKLLPFLSLLLFFNLGGGAGEAWGQDSK